MCRHVWTLFTSIVCAYCSDWWDVVVVGVVSALIGCVQGTRRAVIGGALA